MAPRKEPKTMPQWQAEPCRVPGDHDQAAGDYDEMSRQAEHDEHEGKD
jgi:hypothetical protein